MGMPDDLLTPAPALRHRITFATRRTLAYVSVLELGSLWERSLRRAGVPLKYSQGYNPRPQQHVAAPLPVGCSGAAELLDIELDTPRPAPAIEAALVGKTPPDLRVLGVAAVPEDEPSLAQQLTAAEYRVWIRDADRDTVAARVREFLTADEVRLPKRGRKHRGKTYDLRALVEVLRREDAPPPWVGLWMHLSARPGATGRADEVLKALGYAEFARRCTRTRLILGNAP
jgi:radical SAM-linked protein